MRITALVFGIGFFLVISDSGLRADPAASVVKVTAFTRFPDPTRPWEKGRPVEGGGSGVFIGDNRILTNAHVVSYSSEISVQWHQADEKVDAKILAISVDLDLAVLTVADDKFFAKRKPLPLAKQLPKLKDSVISYGFPRGGAGLSVTKGEVSRINSIAYSAEGYGLQIQISAALNAGNSGGPAVVAGDQMIGLVYSSLAGAQNIGYIIPAEEIDYFLTHIKAGRFTGKPRVITLAKYQTLENDALRRHLGIDKSVQGILIFDTTPDLPLKDLDVVTKIGNHSIDNRGNIQVADGVTAFFMHAVPKAVQGKTVPLTVLRDGKVMSLNMPVHYQDAAVIPRYRGEPLSYFIHGPLVFVPAKLEDVLDYYVRTNPYFSESPLSVRRADHVRFAGEELVVISNQFRHKATRGYPDHAGKVIKSINGTAVKNLRHLVETIRDCRDEFVKIEFAEKSGGIVVFDRVEMENATEQIIEEIGIAATRRGSADLMKVWSGKK